MFINSIELCYSVCIGGRPYSGYPLETLEKHSSKNSHAFSTLSLTAQPFRWGDKDGKTFINSIELCYSEIVHWRKNLFRVPTGFVQELARLFRTFADSSALESVAMRAAMVMPALLIQKPHQRPRTKEHAKHLEQRLKLWSEGDLDALLNEGRTIQTELKHHFRQKKTNNTQIGPKFCQAIDGRESASSTTPAKPKQQQWPLTLGLPGQSEPKTVQEILQAKHPPQHPAKPTSPVDSDTQQQPSAEPHAI